MQQIYIQDCGSTHGTYMDRKRLEAGVEYAVIDGEVITFGQSVTSGAGRSPTKKGFKDDVRLIQCHSHIPC